MLPAGAGGHYEGDFKINGRSVHGLIDTGATYVAINESTARRLGISGNDLDYRYTIQTANGASKVALAKLDRLEIGTIKVRDVDAVVAKDDALSTTLIGMSFLKKAQFLWRRERLIASDSIVASQIRVTITGGRTGAASPIR